MQFCYRNMKKMFMANGAACGPHLVTGNKMRFEKVMDVMNFLFLWDEQERPGWGNKPYRDSDSDDDGSTHGDCARYKTMHVVLTHKAASANRRSGTACGDI